MCYHHHLWPSLATPPYRSSLPAGPQGYIPYPHRAGRPAFARPCERVHRRTSLMSLSLLFQLCPACLVHLTLIFFMMRGKWLYNCCFVGCCLQDLFKRTCVMNSVKYWREVNQYFVHQTVNSLLKIVHYVTIRLVQWFTNILKPGPYLFQCLSRGSPI